MFQKFLSFVLILIVVFILMYFSFKAEAKATLKRKQRLDFLKDKLGFDLDTRRMKKERISSLKGEIDDFQVNIKYEEKSSNNTITTAMTFTFTIPQQNFNFNIQRNTLFSTSSSNVFLHDPQTNEDYLIKTTSKTALVKAVLQDKSIEKRLAYLRPSVESCFNISMSGEQLTLFHEYHKLNDKAIEQIMQEIDLLTIIALRLKQKIDA